MFRFVVLTWNSGAQDATALSLEIQDRLLGSNRHWRVLLGDNGLSVLCADVTPSNTLMLHNQCGVILGTVFRHRPSYDRVASPEKLSLDADETARIIASGGRHLVRHCWGRYVAVLRDPCGPTRWILRDPSGELPCFITTFRGITVFFSCLSDLTEVGMPFSPDWCYLTNRLIFGTAMAGHTGLESVVELYQGECAKITLGNVEKSLYWDPFSIASEDVIEDTQQASVALRSTLKTVTNAWISCHPSILHMLSGGLDSTLLLACLTGSEPSPRVTCVTWRRREATDDLAYAHLASKHYGCELVEEYLIDDSVDFRRLLLVQPHPCPLEQGFSCLWTSPSESRLASERGATAVTDGNPGDNLLGASSHRHGATDYAQRHGLRWRLISESLKLAPWINTSVWMVLRAALRAPRPAYNTDPFPARWRAEHALVSPDATSSVRPEPAIPHPWYRNRQPATRAVVMMADALSYPRRYYDPFRASHKTHPEPLELMKSQPFMELCLRIPPYVANQNGRSRDLVRKAFRTELPPPIAARCWKDVGGNAQQAILHANLPFARELLLDGKLSARGLLDRTCVDRALQRGITAEAVSVGEITDAIVLESWLQTFTRTGQSRSL